jgi:SAM-dependent methyltransferase
MPVHNSTQRFSSRVENYVRYRPGYPPEVLDLLTKECGLTKDSVIADIASGTGIFSRLLLQNGNRVLGVEPNTEMRRAGEEYLGEFARFTSVAGTAEATTLPDHSVDFVTAAQAAHWFDPPSARKEFARILRPGGWLVLIWNVRRSGLTPFLKEFEGLLARYGTDYQEVRHEHSASDIGVFFAPSPFRSHVFETRQVLDYPGTEGRLLSASYSPPPGHPNHEPLLRELRRVFEEYQQDGKVTIEYHTRVYYGQLE